MAIKAKWGQFLMVLVPCCSFGCAQMFLTRPGVSKQVVQKKIMDRCSAVCLKPDQKRQRKLKLSTLTINFRKMWFWTPS